MPPRGSRGGARTGRGGRGRGASGTTPATSEDAVPVSEIASTPGEPQDTPTLSPASLPTETPASTPTALPARAPTQRPDSLTPARGRGRGRGRGAHVAGAAPPTFKPKAVRRDQSERQKAADEERKKIEERNKAAAIAEGRAAGRGRGAFRGARGRGDAMGKRNNIISGGPGTGLFAQLPKKEEQNMKRIADSQYETVGLSGYEGFKGEAGITALPGRPKVNQESSVKGNHNMGGVGSSTGQGGGSSGGPKIKKEVPDPVYPGLVNEGRRPGRVNIEHINLVSEDEDEEGPSGKGKGRVTEKGGGALKPIRVLREEHQERVTVVNTEASGGPTKVKEGDMEADNADDDDGLFVPQDPEAERLRRNKAGVVSRDATGKPWAPVWGDSDSKDDDAVLIKPDPDAPEAMDVDSIPVSLPPESPPNTGEPIIKERPSPKTKHRIRRRGSGLRDKNPVLQTDEDRAEWLRHLEDVAILAEELGGLQTAMIPKTSADHDGDTEMDQEEYQVKDKEGRLYLFQFPPIMPPLCNPNHIKTEATEDNVDIAQISSKPAPGTSGSSTAPIDVSKPTNPNDVIEDIKTEPDDSPWKKESQTAEHLIPEEGFVGKLIVRESGAVELDWGGTDFVLSRGVSHDFLMNTLLMDGLDVEDDSEEDASARHIAGSGLGAVMGKFVVTPDWDMIF